MSLTGLDRERVEEHGVGSGQGGMAAGTHARQAVEVMGKPCPMTRRVRVSSVMSGDGPAWGSCLPSSEGCGRVVLQRAAGPVSYPPLFPGSCLWIFLWETKLSSLAIPEVQEEVQARPMLPQPELPFLTGSRMGI